MDGEEPYWSVVTALHLLIRTTATARPQEAGQAAAGCLAALDQILARDCHLILQHRQGAIHANGYRLRPDVQGMPVLGTLTRLCERLQISELLLEPGVTADSLRTFAERCHRAAGFDDLGGAPMPGLSVGRAGPTAGPLADQATDAAAAALAPRTPASPLGAAGGRGGDSALRQVFLQNQLMLAIDPAGPVPVGIAREVVGAVVERLLLEPAGIQTLRALQEDPNLLRHSLSVCVLSAVLARWLGAADGLIGECAAAGLLHGLGSAGVRRAGLLPRPGDADGEATAFHALLAAGDGDLWLRAALVARAVPDLSTRDVTEALATTSLAAVVVRTADWFDDRWSDGRDAEFELDLEDAVPVAAARELRSALRACRAGAV